MPSGCDRQSASALDRAVGTLTAQKPDDPGDQSVKAASQSVREFK